jgi:hypothetical protein
MTVTILGEHWEAWGIWSVGAEEGPWMVVGLDVSLSID